MSDKPTQNDVEERAAVEDSSSRETAGQSGHVKEIVEKILADKRKPNRETNKENEVDDDEEDEDIDSVDEFLHSKSEDKSDVDPEVIAHNELIASSKPTTPLEIALAAMLKRKESQIQRITGEIAKLKKFVSKRKQTYKRKRKEEGAPTRALSAYNIYIQDRFAKLAKENEKALQSEDTDAELKRVPPSNLVASTGNAWKELPPEQKVQYYER